MSPGLAERGGFRKEGAPQRILHSMILMIGSPIQGHLVPEGIVGPEKGLWSIYVFSWDHSRIWYIAITGYDV